MGTSEAGTSSCDAILEAAGEGQDPYLHSWKDCKSLDGRARPFAPPGRGVGQRREWNEGEEETDIEEVESDSLVGHSGPSDGKAVVPELGLDLGKEGSVYRDVRIRVPRPPSFATEAEGSD